VGGVDAGGGDVTGGDTRFRASQGVITPRSPPQCPAGWLTGPPDFVGIGAQRAGTTRWFDLLAAHPQIQTLPAVGKELHYFDQFHEGGFTAEDAARYREYFPRPHGRLAGEWTPAYLAAPWVAPMLAAAAPAVRLLVTLRDPVERYLSAMQRHRRGATARGTELHALAPQDAVNRGFYHAQLAHWLGHFERSRMLVLQYERCVRDPQAELQRSFTFLGLENAELEPDVAAHPNRQLDKPDLHSDARRALVEIYSPDVTELIRRFPEIDIALWPNFAHLEGPAEPVSALEGR
jgi:hypothetical protein